MEKIETQATWPLENVSHQALLEELFKDVTMAEGVCPQQTHRETDPKGTDTGNFK